MTDYSELKRLAAAAMAGGVADGDALRSACRPTAIWDLVSENEQLVSLLCVCPSCHGQGEIYTGQNTWEGHLQPPEPIMETCGECGGDGSIGDAEDLASLHSERDQLKAENEALRKDAERYRWLREQEAERGVCIIIVGEWTAGATCIATTFHSAEFADEMVDAAMSKEAAHA